MQTENFELGNEVMVTSKSITVGKNEQGYDVSMIQLQVSLTIQVGMSWAFEFYISFF